MYHLTNLTLDIFSLIILIIVLINNFKRKTYETIDQRIYNSLVLANIIVAFVDGIAWFVDQKTFVGAVELNKISNALLYALSPLCGLLWAMFVHFKIYKDEKKLKSFAILTSIPFWMNFIVSFLSIFLGIYFFIGPGNTFQRNSPFSLIPFFLAILYAIYSIINTLIKRKNLSKRNYFPILSYVFIPLICAFIQAVYYGLSLIVPSLTISLVIVYISMQNELNVTDYLTGLSNRTHLVFYLESECKKVRGDEELYGLMLDIDNFKSINDNFGHVEGDKALVTFSSILKKSTTANSFIARYAGDEFVILVKLSKNQSIDDYVRSLQKAVDNLRSLLNTDYNLDYSLGYTKYVSKETYKDFLNRMDSRMYCEKNKKKSLKKD